MPGTNRTIGGGGFHHVALRAADFDASVRFYTQLLGFRETMRWGDAPKQAVMLDTGDGSCVEIFAGGPEGDKPEGALLHMALNCDDVAGVIQKLVDQGVELLSGPSDVDIPTRPEATPVRIAFFKGPDGEVIELFQRR